MARLVCYNLRRLKMTRFTTAFIFAMTLASAQAQISTNALLSLVGPNGSLISLNISNAGNQVWLIQSSSNLTNWKTVETVKVFNGIYHRGYTNGTNGELFYRAYVNSTNQNIASSTTNALGLPATNYNYANPVLPDYFLTNPIAGQDNMATNGPNADPTTDAGATLGRVLFYDKRLSTNQTISCASCHQQANGFSDPRRVSLGFDGSPGTRNSMGLSNARWYQRRHFFWDERANTLEDQSLFPIPNPVEMGLSLEALTNRLASESFYTNLFALAFGSTAITTNRISHALAQFMRSIVTTQSKYDIGLTNNFANFTEQENLGRLIFFGLTNNPPNPPASCSVCHASDNFVPGPAVNNNGLEYPYGDLGVGGITGNTNQNGLFKVPSLRNIALTAPYMHDGRFTNLAQVVNFYSTGVVNNPNLSAPLLTGPGGQPLRLNLTTAQHAALVAFLNTLTDTNLATDPQLSDPFNYGN